MRRDALKDGAWYWVKIHGGWVIAMYSPDACGGWTNEDTWEDFDGDVTEWVEIPLPDEIQKEEN